MSISVFKLNKYFGKQCVLKEVSFDVGRAEVVGFLGSNGAGKSTTMKILAGALNYDSGSVKICGKEVSENVQFTKSHIGYLPEQNPLYVDMYVREYLHFVADLHRISDKKVRIEQAINTVQIGREAYKKIRELSKGYRQRVGLAQALMHNPDVLILDEPTTGLDPNQLREIRRLIKRIGEERTVLLSTHIMQEIEAVCDRVIVINEGEIVADFPDINTMKQYHEKSNKMKIQFSSAIDVARFVHLPLTILERIDDRLFTVVTETDIRETIFDFAVTNGYKLIGLELLEQDMEHIFRSLTSTRLSSEEL